MNLWQAYAGTLRAHGLIAANDSDGRPRFRYEGDHDVLQTHDDEQHYVSISATYRLPIGVRRQRARSEANRATRRSQVANVYVLPNRAVSIAARHLVGIPGDVESVLIRLIRFVQSVASGYVSYLAKE